MVSLCDLDIEQLRGALAMAGLVPSHAGPVLREFYRGAGAIDFSRLRCGPRVASWIDTQFTGLRSHVRSRAVSADGTIKLLIAFADGAAVESVLMPGYRSDRAAC